MTKNWKAALSAARALCLLIAWEQGYCAAADTMPQTHLVSVDNARLEVLDWGGSGRPLFFIPGLGGTDHTFDMLVPKFTGKYHVYTFTPRARDPSGTRSGDDVIAVVNGLKLNRPVLVGHSLACKELGSVGSRYPEKVSGLIYLDACFYVSVTASGVSKLGPEEYPAINLPILAIAATPPSDERKIQLVNAFQVAQPKAHVVRLSNAKHDIWKSNQADVLREMNVFMDGLPR